MERQLEHCLARPIDYSPGFTLRVGEIGERLSAELGVPVRQDSDMNYNPGQLLVVHLDAGGGPAAEETGAAWRLTVAVSSRGPLWALLIARAGHRPRLWLHTPAADVEHGAGSDVVTAVARVMAAAGLERLPDADLDRPAPGQVTQLEGVPATLREALFCEVC
jgi:hypothetical protein